MKHFMLLFAKNAAYIGLGCLLGACVRYYPMKPDTDPTTEPEPLPPPPATCASACSHLEDLGGCGVDVSQCITHCNDAREAESEIGIAFPRRLPRSSYRLPRSEVLSINSR